ncbi:MAG: universal stress protein [Chloroflexi bacterium]|nr:universal stress protein [Chloroflexota bacterium]
MDQINKIMVPLDGSFLAEKVLAPAATLAQSMNATLLLVRVREPVVQMADENLMAQVQEIRSNEVIVYLKQIMQSPLLQDVKKESLIVHGPVAGMLIDSAIEHDISLIMMSSHGRSGIGRWMYGSVARKVLRHAPCDKIILQASVDVPLFAHNRILVTLDGSRLAEKAIVPAVSIAKAIKAELILLRVTDLPQIAVDTVDPLVMKQDLDKLEARERIEAKAYLEHVAKNISDNKIPVRIEIISGAVAETIQVYAENHPVDLIVMASHGRSGIGRWVRGSVAEKVLHSAPCGIYILQGAQK